mmetsp:Transcript_13399/g.29515  ORF Transcript_13399/g.29515 Transcript_13399/m.29515 type:complete len:134 (-) Transcript_13399:30-431(-)
MIFSRDVLTDSSPEPAVEEDEEEELIPLFGASSAAPVPGQFSTVAWRLEPDLEPEARLLEVEVERESATNEGMEGSGATAAATTAVAAAALASARFEKRGLEDAEDGGSSAASAGAEVVVVEEPAPRCCDCCR